MGAIGPVKSNTTFSKGLSPASLHLAVFENVGLLAFANLHGMQEQLSLLLDNTVLLNGSPKSTPNSNNLWMYSAE